MVDGVESGRQIKEAKTRQLPKMLAEIGEIIEKLDFGVQKL